MPSGENLVSSGVNPAETSFCFISSRDIFSVLMRRTSGGNSLFAEHKALVSSGPNIFIHFLTSHYRTIYVLDMRYCSFQLSDYVKENAIDQVLFLYNIQTIRNDMGILKVK